MSNKIETVSIGDLPIATELDDADELLLRDVSATLPENATARLSIATLRAAMGGGSPDRIESPSGAAFAEATDDFAGEGVPAAVSGADANGASAKVVAGVVPSERGGFAWVWAGEEGDLESGARFGAHYNAETGVKALLAVGAPLEIEEPVESNHAATKGYVDARPGAEEWSEHPATQDVDLDGHKLTGLGEPTDASDAATKGYVDGAAPAKIERTFSWGRSVAEVADNGDIELAVYRTGETDPLRLVRVYRGDVGGSIALVNRSGMGANDWQTELILGTVSPSLRFRTTGGPSGGASSRGGVSFHGGRWLFTERNGAEVPLGSEGYYALPSGVSSIKHGVHLAKEAYDTLASMPAPPDLEWWDPTWTAIENVDSVANVECSYTRTYRAAGGSLVTLEGTIEVTPTAADVQTMVTAPLPVARVGTENIAGTASFTNLAGSDAGWALAGVADLGAGQLVAIQYTPGSEGETHRIGFRISYRAA